jgi:hypothetical protein
MRSIRQSEDCREWMHIIPESADGVNTPWDFKMEAHTIMPLSTNEIIT